jgi:hypothetical protein
MKHWELHGFKHEKWGLHLEWLGFYHQKLWFDKPRNRLLTLLNREPLMVGTNRTLKQKEVTQWEFTHKKWADTFSNPAL